MTAAISPRTAVSPERLRGLGVDEADLAMACRLAAWLEEKRITGAVPTDRASNIHNLRALAERDPYYTFGVDLDQKWDEPSLLAMMHRRVGISDDPSFEHGQDRIDTGLCIAGLTRYAHVIAQVASRRGKFLFATGHPACLGLIYVPIIRALRARGCEIFSLDRLLGSDSPVTGTVLSVDGPDEGEVRQVEGVLMRYHNGNLMHTHQPQYMEAVSRRMEEAGWRPDLVVADHGWAAVAGRHGYRTIGIADCNDGALFVSAEQGEVEVCVPMDDGEPESSTWPIVRYILRVAGLTRLNRPVE